MDGVTTFRSLTTGVFPIACKTESRIPFLCAIIFSPPAAVSRFPPCRHNPVPHLRENPPLDCRLPLIQHPAGSHPYLQKEAHDDESEPGSCKQRHRTNPRTLRGCAHTKTRDR